jgi:hypothetical protein
VNPPHLRVWAPFDIDRPGAALAWEHADLPPPTWTAINKENGHAHSAWGLEVPVLVDGMGARDAPMRYLCAVESLMRERLQADAGFSGLITKNPTHPLWRVLRGPRLAYGLGELGEYLPGLEKHRPRRAPEQVGLGRNVTLFDRLRRWAYRAIREHWGGGLQAWNAWLSQCNNRALVMNADFPLPLDGREVWHLARSVAKWTWRRTTLEGYAAWRTEQGRRGAAAAAKVKRLASEDKRASARLMRAQGQSFRAIAAELGVSLRTAFVWCQD